MIERISTLIMFFVLAGCFGLVGCAGTSKHTSGKKAETKAENIEDKKNEKEVETKKDEAGERKEDAGETREEAGGNKPDGDRVASEEEKSGDGGTEVSGEE
jgi:hypothetical protein